MLESLIRIMCLADNLNEAQEEKVLNAVAIYYAKTNKIPLSNQIKNLIEKIKGEK